LLGIAGEQPAEIKASRSTKTSTAAHQKGRQPIEEPAGDMQVEKQDGRQLGEGPAEGRWECCASAAE